MVSRAQAEPPLVLALDVGTSSCRASLYDASGRRLSDSGSQIRYEVRTTADGGAELDADVLVRQVHQVLDHLVAECGAIVGSVRAVATCTLWHSLLGINKDGWAATPLYLWMDARSRQQAEALKSQLDERAVHARTGCVLHWSYWPAKLLWLREGQPEVFRTVWRWASFGEYLQLRLFGETAVSVSMASGTGLLNQHTCDWDDELLAVLSIERGQLAPIAATPAIAPPGRRTAEVGPSPAWGGETRAGLSAVYRVPWLLPMGDGACSNIGAGCTTRERMALMVGTSGALRVLWRTERVSIPWGAWCYRADRQRVVVGGALNDGGSLLDWLRETLQLPAVEEAESAVAALEPDAHGLTLLPLWAGERSPGWAADARGAIVGLRLHTSPLEILRAALEGVALSFARIETIVRRAVPEVGEVIATGGALLNSPAWLQIMADVLGNPVLASAEPEASSRGAALLALEALGALPAGIEALPAPIGRVYEPVPAHTERYRSAAERQARLYEVLVGGTLPSS